MRTTLALTFVLLISFQLNAESKPRIDEWRIKVGPVYAPPAEYKDSLYFLGSTGGLFKIDKEFGNFKDLFKTNLKTVSGILLDQGILYFGEGLHDDKKSDFYAFDIEKSKLLFKTAVKGHVEKKPVLVGNLVITGIGPGGLIAIDKKSGEIKWTLDSVEGKKLHIDSTPLVSGDKIFVGAIYDYKGVLSVEAATGKVLWATATDKSVKTDLRFAGDKIVTFATEANFTNEKRDIPSDFLVFDSKSGKKLVSKELRGSNLFPQLISGNEVFTSLSTGDVITIDLKKGDVKVIDQVPEPFLASTFKRAGQNCAVSVMGRAFCYKGKKKMSSENLNENVLGWIDSAPKGSIFLPTRVGYRKF
jgi:outer membrane protein assembly factor BamB